MSPNATRPMTTLTPKNQGNFPFTSISLRTNDPQMVKIAECAFAATLQNTKEALATNPIAVPKTDIRKPDSDMMNQHITLLFERIKKHKNSKWHMSGTKKGAPFIAVVWCSIDLREIEKSLKGKNMVEQGLIKEEDIKSLDYTRGHIDRTNCPASFVPREHECSGWPSEMSEQWGYYCLCGSCRAPMWWFTFSLSFVVDNGACNLPIKVHAFPHSTICDPFLKLTLTSEHHIAASNGMYVTVHNPEDRIQIVTKQVTVYVPDEQVRKVFDERDEWGNFVNRKENRIPFQCGLGGAAQGGGGIVYVSDQKEEQPLSDGMVFNHASRIGCDLTKDDDGCVVM